MLTLNIPGRNVLELNHLVLDFNGSIAFDGMLLPGVAEKIQFVSEQLAVHVITADTNGSVKKECMGMPVSVKILSSEDHTAEKGEFVRNLAGTICIGNGANDAAMFEACDIAIAVIGGEGCAVSTLKKSDIIVKNAVDAVDLLLHPNRMIATLRK